MKLSEYVRTYRTFQKLSLRAMAEKCGCSFQYLAKLENDEINNPSLEMVKKIADGTDVSVHELLSLVDNVDVQIANQEQIDRRIVLLQMELERLQRAKYEGYYPEQMLSVVIENDNEKRLLEYYRYLTEKQQEAVLAMVDSMAQKDGE